MIDQEKWKLLERIKELEDALRPFAEFSRRFDYAEKDDDALEYFYSSRMDGDKPLLPIRAFWNARDTLEDGDDF